MVITSRSWDVNVNPTIMVLIPKLHTEIPDGALKCEVLGVYICI